MARRLSPAITFTTGAAIVGLALSACGSSSLSTPETSKSAPATAQAVDPALAAKLPAKVKSAGQIVVGTDATYAPNEFLNADGKTVQGMDVDLFNAVMQKFGVKVVWQPASFDSIITGVQGGKYDIGVSSFTINNDRKKQVNMVSYFNAGTQWATPPGNPKKVDPQSPCGLKVAVQKGTVQAETTCRPRSRRAPPRASPSTCRSTAARTRPPQPWRQARPTPCWPTPPSSPTRSSSPAARSRRPAMSMTRPPTATSCPRPRPRSPRRSPTR